MAELGVNNIFNVQPTNPLDQASKALGVAQQAQALDTAQFDLALKQLGVLRGVTASLLSDPEAGGKDLTKKVQSETSKLVGMGLYTPQQAVQFLKTWPSSPIEQYKFLIKTHAETLSASEQLGAIFGSPSGTDVGGDIIEKQTPVYPGLPVRERSAIRRNLPPTTTTPNPETLQPEYLGDRNPPIVEQRPGSISQTPTNRLQSGGPPFAPANPLRQSPPPGTDVAPAAGAGSRAAGARIPAAFPQGSETSSAAAAKSVAEARDEAGNYQERVNPTRNMIELLVKIPDKDIGRIGPGSEQFNRLKSGLVTWGLGEIAGVDPQKVADFNKLKKYMADAASRRAQGLGPHTNDGLAAAVSASPNVKLDKLSATELAKVNLAIDRMIQARVLEFDQQNLPDAKWGTWKAQFATQQDPRAFIYDLMTPEAQQKLLKDMNAKQRAKFEKSLELADKHGLLGDVRE